MGSTENYTKLCTIKIDLSRLPLSSRPKYFGKGSFYRLEYDIILLFGLTELKTLVAWKQNVGLFLVLISLSFFMFFFRVLSDGVQRRLCTTQTQPTTTLEVPALPSCTYNWATLWNFVLSDYLFQLVDLIQWPSVLVELISLNIRFWITFIKPLLPKQHTGKVAGALWHGLIYYCERSEHSFSKGWGCEIGPNKQSQILLALGLEEKVPLLTRGFQKFNTIPGVDFFISQGFAEPTTHVIQAHFYIW